MAKRLQIIQFVLAAIGIIGLTVSIVSSDTTGMIESFAIIGMAIIMGFLDSYVRKKQGMKSNS